MLFLIGFVTKAVPIQQRVPFLDVGVLVDRSLEEQVINVPCFRSVDIVEAQLHVLERYLATRLS